MVTRRSSRQATMLGALLGATLASAPLLAADPKPSAMEVAAARKLAKEGVKAADAGDCAGAIEKLERAESLFHAPTILGRLGECQVAVGRLVVGLENLEHVVREELAPKAPAAFQAAKERARKVLEKNRDRVARLKIVVEGPDAAACTVMVDKVPLPNALIGSEAPADAGEHEISASAAGFVTARAKVTLTEGAGAEAKLVLQPVAVEKKAPEKAVERPIVLPVVVDSQATARLERAKTARTLGWVGLGTGAAGLALGGTFGILALVKKSALDKGCVNKECPASAQGGIDVLKRDGNIATAGFVAGGVLAATGAALLIAFPPEPTAGPKPRVAVSPTLLPGYAAAVVSGTF